MDFSPNLEYLNLVYLIILKQLVSDEASPVKVISKSLFSGYFETLNIKKYK